MSSVSLSLKMLLAASAVAGVTLLACGEDSGGGSDDDDSGNDEGSTGRRDAGRDSGRNNGRRDASQITIVEPGDECEAEGIGAIGGACECPDGESGQCVAQCVDGVYGDCEPVTSIIDRFRDGGFGNIGDYLRDAGGAVINPDAGIRINDAGIPTSMCPSDFLCEDGTGTSPSAIAIGLAKTAVGGAGICVEKESMAPTECSSASDCSSAGFGAATCIDIAQFDPSLPTLLGFLGFPPKFCAAPCNP